MIVWSNFVFLGWLKCNFYSVFSSFCFWRTWKKEKTLSCNYRECWPFSPKIPFFKCIFLRLLLLLLLFFFFSFLPFQLSSSLFPFFFLNSFSNNSCFSFWNFLASFASAVLVSSFVRLSFQTSPFWNSCWFHFWVVLWFFSCFAFFRCLDKTFCGPTSGLQQNGVFCFQNSESVFLFACFAAFFKCISLKTLSCCGFRENSNSKIWKKPFGRLGSWPSKRLGSGQRSSWSRT